MDVRSRHFLQPHLPEVRRGRGPTQAHASASASCARCDSSRPSGYPTADSPIPRRWVSHSCRRSEVRPTPRRSSGCA